MNPDFFLDEFSEADSDSFLVHWEGNNNVHRTVQRVKSLGKRVGIGINPATSAAVLEAILQDVDHVLVMTVNPGFDISISSIRHCQNFACPRDDREGQAWL